MTTPRLVSAGGSLLLAGTLALVARDAAATDVVAAQPPAAIADSTLTIGGRSLRLPEGNWTFAARTEGKIGKGHVDRGSVYYTVYAMNVAGGQMRSAVVLRMPPNSVMASAWTDQPCKEQQASLFKDDFGPDFKQPACLVVNKRRGHLSASQGDAFYGQAQRWAESQGIRSLGPVYEISFTKFASNDFGLVRVFLPQDAFSGDDAAVQWAKALPAHVQRLFENRDSQAALPPFPAGGNRP